VAGEAFGRGLRLAEFQDAGHALADIAGERGVSLRMLVFHDPGAVLVLEDVVHIAWRDAAVAARGGAGPGPGVFADFICDACGCRLGASAGARVAANREHGIAQQKSSQKREDGEETRVRCFQLLFHFPFGGAGQSAAEPAAENFFKSATLYYPTSGKSTKSKTFASGGLPPNVARLFRGEAVPWRKNPRV